MLTCVDGDTAGCTVTSLPERGQYLETLMRPLHLYLCRCQPLLLHLNWLKVVFPVLFLSVFSHFCYHMVIVNEFYYFWMSSKDHFTWVFAHCEKLRIPFWVNNMVTNLALEMTKRCRSTNYNSKLHQFNQCVWFMFRAQLIVHLLLSEHEVKLKTM